MCGIAGFVTVDGLHGDAIGRTIAMRDSLEHRGPDDAGLWSDSHAVLAHRRLSIVDLSRGHQPLSNEDGSVWVVYNGEIYNHADIRHELTRHGHQFRTTCDTETIVHAYESWGDEAVQRFRGMFAFGLWDTRRRRLLLVRDRLGVKPLYWAQVGDRLLFGSEIKALLASGLLPRQAREDLIPEMLSTRSVAGDDTLFAGIHKLQPGHQLVYEDGQVIIRRYWDLPVAQPGDARRAVATSATSWTDLAAQSGASPAPAATVVAEFRRRLEESVRLRLMADVPLGMFLSGGIDSSAVAALMSRMIDRPLQTFSVAFADRAFNELQYSREVAQAVGADAHEVVVDEAEFFGLLPRLIWHEDEPLAHPSSVPLFAVSRLARQHVKVVLTGEGSDELLAGYGRYPRIVWNWWAGTAWERAMPASVRQFVARRLVPRVRGRLGRYARRSFAAMPRTPAAMLFDNFAAIRLQDQQQLLSPALRRFAVEGHAYRGAVDQFNRPDASASFLDRVLYADVKTYLVELLMKQDQMSMAASIESRVPFLDHHMVEFAATLPDQWKLAGWTTKRILREAMKGLLPERILNRPKMGFPVPLARWTRTSALPMVREVLLDRRTRERGVVSGPAIERLLRDHVSGAAEAGDQIWSLLNLELWFRTFIDGDGIQQLPTVTAEAPSVAALAEATATPVPDGVSHGTPKHRAGHQAARA